MLDPHLEIVIATALIFLMLIIFLNQVLYKPLLGFIDNRNNTIKQDLEDANKNSSDVSVYYDEANQIILDAKNEALKIRTALVAEAKKSYNEKITIERSNLESEYNEFLKKIGSEKEELRNALLLNMSSYQDLIKNKLSKI